MDETADLKVAAQQIAIGAYQYAGQICISTQRIYVHQAIAQEFQSLLLAEIDKIPSGDPTQAGTINGPIINEEHFQRVCNWIEEAIKGGANILAGGKAMNEHHHVYAPTLLTNTKKGMKVVDEEVFGPVAIIETVANIQEGINAINDASFGLQAGIFTNRLDQFKMATKMLEVGGILFNNIPGFRVDGMPYGGIKDSGLGREGIRYAMEDMTESKLIVW